MKDSQSRHTGKTSFAENTCTEPRIPIRRECLRQWDRFFRSGLFVYHKIVELCDLVKTFDSFRDTLRSATNDLSTLCSLIVGFVTPYVECIYAAVLIGGFN